MLMRLWGFKLGSLDKGSISVRLPQFISGGRDGFIDLPEGGEEESAFGGAATSVAGGWQGVAGLIPSFLGPAHARKHMLA